MWEVWERRRVTRNGRSAGRAGHEAVVRWTDDSEPLTVALEDERNLRLEVDAPVVHVPLGDVFAAIADLQRLQGGAEPLPDQTVEMRERAAEVVERACDILQGLGPLGEQAATDLRATMLQLIYRASKSS